MAVIRRQGPSEEDKRRLKEEIIGNKFTHPHLLEEATK